MKIFQFFIALTFFFSDIQNVQSQTNVFTSTQQIQASSAEPHQDNSTGISLGMKFQSSVNGQVTGIRFYKSSTNVGMHTGHLWNSAGTSLGSVTFTNETASGWQTAILSTPVSITAGQIYVVSYHSNLGHYNSSGSFFVTTTANGPLTALASSTSPNGVYIYSTTPAFPNQSYSASNYWVDIVFTTNTGDITSPTVVTTTPGTSSTGVATNTTINVQFSEALQATSVTTASAYIMNGATTVGSTVSYTAGSQNIILTPTNALEAGTTYTVTIKGGAGANKILDVAGNPLSADYTWTFTTQSTGGNSAGWILNGTNLVNSNAGFVGIATNINPAPADNALKLAVNGNIIARKLKITQLDWADYVFEPEYKLRPLKDLENYIHQYNHLPDVPSALEVEKNGIDLGDSQALLLKKIEELTLYIIKQQRQIDELETRLIKKKKSRKK
jgi:Domain of unknown function (DUF4082)/Bacterial Ig-like domain